MERFPQAPICRPVESVEMLAKAAMGPTAATAAMKRLVQNDGADMKQLLRQAAMAAFATPHVVIALYVHEVVFFQELVALEQFQVSETRRVSIWVGSPRLPVDIALTPSRAVKLLRNFRVVACVAPPLLAERSGSHADESLPSFYLRQVQTPSGLGVRMICPYCETNELVDTPGMSGNGFPSLSSQKVRCAIACRCTDEIGAKDTDGL